MLRKISFILIFTICFVVAAYAQEQASQESKPAPATNQVNIISEKEPSLDEELMKLEPEESNGTGQADLQWVWGEITAVDLVNSNIKVKFLDYGTDGEKEAQYFLNKDSQLENISSAQEIKVGMSAGIDYSIDAENKFIIKAISVEQANPPVGQ
jgi:hypothetical protein